MSKRIDTQLTMDALDMALATREVCPGLIHHSDRGVQYANTAYVQRLESIGARVSMSAVGDPYDNAKAESFAQDLENRGGVSQAVSELYRGGSQHSAISRRGV